MAPGRGAAATEQGARQWRVAPREHHRLKRKLHKAVSVHFPTLPAAVQRSVMSPAAAIALYVMLRRRTPGPAYAAPRRRDLPLALFRR